MKKTITILTPTYNEEDNIDELYSRISIITKKNRILSFCKNYFSVYTAVIILLHNLQYYIDSS